jgi:predicted DNA-binding protein (UPF0251 family)
MVSEVAVKEPPVKPGRPSADETEELERKCWRLRFKENLTTRQIAARLKVRPNTVCDAIKRAQVKLRAEFPNEARDIMEEHTEKLWEIASEFYQDYQTAKKGTKRVRTIQKLPKDAAQRALAGPDGFITLTIVDAIPGKANPAIGAQYRGALRDIRAIWGAEAATKVTLSTGQNEDDIGADNGRPPLNSANRRQSLGPCTKGPDEARTVQQRADRGRFAGGRQGPQAHR